MFILLQMSVRLIMVMAVCRWSLVVEAAPAPALPTKLDQNQTNDLEQLSLPNFSAASSDVDVNQTVDQVEQILKAYPSLPRLTKGDILTLLNNITTEDKLTQQNKTHKRIAQKSKATKSNRASDIKPLMVVLPYKAADTTNGDVTELYTKAPIIRYISPKPVRGKVEDDVVDSESAFTNHKYTDDETTKKTKHTLQDDFWHNEAQRVMNDLKKQSDGVALKNAQKEEKNTDPKEISFKKMPSLKTPQSFNHKLPEIVSVETFSQDEKTGTQTSDQSGEFSGPALPENMSDLLQSMGLYEKDNIAENIPFKYINNPSTDTVKLAEYSDIQTPLKPFQSALLPESSAYMEFKPMPLAKKPSKEAQNLDAILNSYGIFGAVNEEYLPNLSVNSQISMGQDLNKNAEFIQPDLFPADMTSMLTEMGLTGKRGRKINFLTSESEETKLNKNSGFDLDLNETHGYSLGAGPDPMSVEEIYPTQDLGELVKRQENESVTEKLIEINPQSTSKNNGGADDSSSSSSSDNADDEESKSNNDDGSNEKIVVSNTSEKLESLGNEATNLADLESSFGASPADNDPSEAELPPPRKNGFYYMVDWNSFLEVGEGDTKVNIRFNPKLGDPQRFLAVTVP